jgi:hypothetical protein
VVAESALIKHQLLILNRGRKRAPNLRVSDRIIVGLCALLMLPARVLRSAIVLKPSTLLHFHNMLATADKIELLKKAFAEVHNCECDRASLLVDAAKDP